MTAVAFVVRAQIPRRVCRRSLGAGLGHEFLRHIERTKMMIHVVDAAGSEGRDPIEDFDKINNELAKYSEHLMKKPQIVAANKIDMVDEDGPEYTRFKEYVEAKGYKVFPISAPINVGVPQLMEEAAKMLATVEAQPLEETMGALAHAVRSGKALYAGISNYTAAAAKQAAAILRDLHCPVVINQIRYSIFNRGIEPDGLKQAAAESGYGLIAFSPLAQGLLTDKYLCGIPADSRIASDSVFLNKKDLTKARLQQISALNNIARNRGQTLAQMALSWVLRDGAVTSVLIGASKASQITENLQVLNAPDFSTEELAAIDSIAPVHTDA